MSENMARRRIWAAWTALALFVSVVVIPAAQPAAQAASPASSASLADFEGGVPAGWFAFAGGSAVSTTTQIVGDSDPLAIPGQVGANEILNATYDVFDFGGFGQDVNLAFAGPQDWSTYESFDFWFYGTGSGLTYQAEISDNRSNPATDTSERFDYEFTDTVAGWQYISIPFADFTRATDFQPGGAPDDGFTLTEIWAWAIVLPLGADTVYFDDFGLGLNVIEDFESGLPSGVDGNGVNVGFHTFQGDGSVAIATAAAPTPPGALTPNSVLQLDIDVSTFGGFIHSFENDTADAWVPQDWSAYSGFTVWMYGTGSGINTFIDVLGKRNPGSTTDDAQRWRVDIVDDVAGWRYLQVPFSDLRFFGVGNGAPGAGAGLDLTDIHGWAFGTLNTSGPVTYYFDDLALFGIAEIPELTVSFASNDFEIEEGTTGPITVKLNREMNEDDPAQVSVDYTIETIVAVEGRDFLPAPAGTFTFLNGGPIEQTFDIATIDDDKWEPTERLILRLSNPVDVPLGSTQQASASIIDNDPYDPLLLDDFETYPYLWESGDAVSLDNPELADGDAMAVPGQGEFERVLEAQTSLPILVEGSVCNQGNGVIPVTLLTTDDFDATTVDHTTVTLGDAGETHVDQKTGLAKRHEEDADGDGDMDLVFHFRFGETGLECDPDVVPFSGRTFDGESITAFGRDFPIGQDWTRTEAMSFWYYGQGTGEEVTIELLDNRAPDPGPTGWSLVWGDEFNEPAGTPPNPENWGYELGDGTVNGIPGWGNDELQYYTDSPDNAATDGQGNLVVTAAPANGQQCYYGECEYTSARLVTTKRAEFAYGRIESRILVPDGDAGLWPAFWSLGTDIDLVQWPQTGEIDIMEYVSRLPDEVFGTIHGPGYSGGNAFGNIQPLANVAADYHTFAIEWQPDRIDWYVDGILYHTATPANVAPNEWVFNDPVYLLLNLALGGNFGGPLDPGLTFPQSMKVDYVRVYQGPDTAERFEASFVDNFEGWQEVVVPFEWFTRSTEQPAGAPDDGLTLSDVWGYGFDVPWSGTTWIDQVRLVPLPPPTEIVVTNLNDSGDGSLRQALEDIANVGGTITFDPALGGGTVALTSGPLVVGKSVTIDAVDAPGISIDGGGIDRVLIVDPGNGVTVRNLTMTNGYGFQLAGCVLNNGNLTLDHVTVTGCTMTTDAGDFWQGGGGIYTGTGGVVSLIDSTVADNYSGWSGGGVYGFFGSTTNVTRSTISGNTAQDVGGGIRMLGDANIANSTISGNVSTAWHGGAAFHTDGIMTLLNTTVADNSAPAGTAGGLFVGTFTDAAATLTLHSSIVANNTGNNCFTGFFGGGAVSLSSLDSNLTSDASCNLTAAGDQPNTDPLLGPLADNGGPTLTHALGAGSPAIDAADAGACPATDQRGVARPLGAGCDVGAYEADSGS
ncbi:MAG: family 16 glycosylhydrolase [Acidimicrobiia bacterium]|nr:family 16 glycosylhydrolase [Acidimicrobiia bacterium]